MKSTLQSHPIASLQGEVQIPGDKSISHRALLLASISQGETRIKGFLSSEDCLATRDALKNMGVCIEGPYQGEVQVQGVGKYGFKAPTRPVHCGNSGTTMRLLAGLLVAQPFATQLIGDDSLSQRPMQRIAAPLTFMGAKIRTTEGKAPLFIEPVAVLQGITYALPQPSAQVKSCLLLAGLYAKAKTTVIEAIPTRDHTERMLAKFGFSIQKKGQHWIVSSEKEGLATDLSIPKDLSSAAFLIVAASIVPHSRIVLPQIGVNPTRIGILTILKQMGAAITVSNHQWQEEEVVADILVESSQLQGIRIKKEWVSLAIDEFPILFIAAACAKGVTVMEGIGELRHKESDRITSMVTGLQQLGIHAIAQEDGAMIEGGNLQGGVVDSADDHRVAMAFVIAGAVAKEPIEIKNCENIATSFPNFIATVNALGMTVKEK